MKRSALFAVAIAYSLLLSIPFAAKAYAAAATLYLSPASITVNQNSYLTVSVRENSGSEPVNAAQVNLSYSSNLSYVSISSSSAFGIVAQNSGGSGSVQIGRGTISPVTGSQLIASVRFKALASSGTATVSIAGGSAVVSANSNENIASGLSGGSYTLAPPAPAAPTPEAPAKDTIPPKITNVKATNVTFNSATVTWTTSEPANSEVDYGTSKNYGWAAADTSTVTDHKITLSNLLLSPATDYHFMVKSADSSGNASSSADGTFTTVGAKLLVTLVSQKNKPISGAKISILSSIAKTDSKGIATLTGLTLGKHTLVINNHGQTSTKDITVNQPDGKNSPQPLKVQIKVSPNLVPLVFAILVIGVGILGWFWYKNGGPPQITWKNLRQKVPFRSNTPGPVVIKPINKQ